MPLDKNTLKQHLITLFKELKNNDNQQDSINVFADGLAEAIHKYVSKGEVVAGQDVATTGSATAQTGKTITNGTLI